MSQKGNTKKSLRISAAKIKTLGGNDVDGNNASEEIAVFPSIPDPTKTTP